jgi:hypothetical protein
MRLTNKRTWPKFLDASTLESTQDDCEILYCLRRTPVFACNFPRHRRLPDDHAHHIRRQLVTIKDCCVVSNTIRQTENPDERQVAHSRRSCIGRSSEFENCHQSETSQGLKTAFT